MGGIEDAQAGSTKRRGKKAIAEGFLTRVRREIKGRSHDFLAKGRGCALMLDPRERK